MSLEQLKKLDNYYFFLRHVDKDKILLSSTPFFVNIYDKYFDMTILRDVDFSFKIDLDDDKEFELLAVPKWYNNKRDILIKLYDSYKKNKINENGIKSVLKFNINYNSIKDFNNNKSLNFNNFKVKCWSKIMNKNSYYCTNPNICVHTDLIINNIKI